MGAKNSRKMGAHNFRLLSLGFSAIFLFLWLVVVQAEEPAADRPSPPGPQTSHGPQRLRRLWALEFPSRGLLHGLRQRGYPHIGISIDIDMDIDSDMAVSVNWSFQGSFKGYRAI